MPGASQWFRGGIVAYDNRVKVDLLGVPQELIDEHGAVSAPVAEAMAVGCRARLGTDLAVSTTGIAGPGVPAADKPVGLVLRRAGVGGRRALAAVELGRHPHRGAEPHGEAGAGPGALAPVAHN